MIVLLAAATAADAQRRRLPSRTEPIPDTETGAKAGSAGNEEPRLMIYGPAEPPLGASSSSKPPPSAPEAATKPAPAAEPAAVSPSPPAPVATPAPAPAPVATPPPAAVPTPPPVSRPTPSQPEPVAVPIPTPAPAPVAAPAPVVAPPPAPVFVPPPVAKPAPAQPEPVAAPIPAQPAAPTPVAAPAPKPVAPPPIAKPAPIVAPPVAKPAPERREVAVAAPAPPAGLRLDPKTVEQIFSCLAPGLPADWKRTWIEVTNSGSALTAKSYFTTSLRREDGEEFASCNAQALARRIADLSAGLPPEQQRWRTARLSIDSEGAYELLYDPR